MKKQYDKICKYCGDPFKAKRSNQEFCSTTHAKYDHEVRKGNRERPARPQAYKQLTESEELIIQKEIEFLNSEKQDIINKIERLKNDYDSEIDIIKKNALELIRRKFRITEKINHLIRSTIDPMNMTGEQVHRYAQSKNTYPFSEYKSYFQNEDDHDYLFASIGDQVQPFRAGIIGVEGIGKTIASLKIANHLISLLNAKVLFVCDINQENKTLNYVRYFSSLNDNFSFRVLTSEMQLRAELQKEEYEFLFIDSLNRFVSNVSFFDDMLIAHPRLSIFGTLEETKSKYSNLFNIEFRLAIESEFLPGSRQHLYAECIAKVITKENDNKSISIYVYHYKDDSLYIDDF